MTRLLWTPERARSGFLLLAALAIAAVLSSGLVALAPPAHADAASISLSPSGPTQLSVGTVGYISVSAYVPADDFIEMYDETTGQELQGYSHDYPSDTQNVTFSVTTPTTAQTYQGFVTSALDYTPYTPSTAVASSNTITITVTSWRITASSPNTHVPSGVIASMSAKTNQSYFYYIEFYRKSDGHEMQGCPMNGSRTSCSFTFYMPSTPVTYFAAVMTASDSTFNTADAIAVSAPLTFYPSGPGLVLSAAGTSLTATSSQAATSSAPLSIWNVSTRSVLNSCTSGTTCTATATSSPQMYVAFIAASGSSYPPTGAQARSRVIWAPDGPGYNDDPSQNNTGSCVCDPVYTSTGELVESATDLAIAGPGPGLNLSREYRSGQASVLGHLGYGWTSGYDMWISTQAFGFDTTDTTGAVFDVHQENGAIDSFTEQADGSFTAGSQVLATLTRHSDGTLTFTRRGAEKFTFSAAGQLTSESDLGGDTTSLAYDPNGWLSTVTDAAGRTLTYTYNSSGLISTVTDPVGRTVTYGYTGGNLTSVTDPAGRVWSYGYDSLHVMTSATDPRGHDTTTSYDSAGRVTSQTDRASRTTGLSYDDAHGTVVLTDPRGNQTAQVYSDGLLTSQTIGYGTSAAATTSYTYDSSTHGVTEITPPSGHSVSATYDAAGNKTSDTDALGDSESWTYNGYDQPLTYTDRNGVQTTYSYDSDHNLTSISTPLTGTGTNRVTSYTYGDSRHPTDATAITDPRGKTTTYAYDTYGQLISVTDPNGDQTTNSYACSSCTTAYANIGWLYSTVSPRGNASGATPSDYRTSYTYNADGDQLSATDPLGHETDTTYNTDGDIATVTDPRGHTTTYTYNNDGQPSGATLPDTTTTATGYNADGEVTSQTDGNGHETDYAYNGLNQLSSTTTPATATHSGGIVTTYTYDADGNMATATKPGSGGSDLTTTYGYDHANRMTSVTYSDGTTPNITLGYDANGNRTSMSDGTGNSSYTYDSLDRLTSTTDGNGDTVSYDYDLDGNVTSIGYPNGHDVTRAYDDSGRLSDVTDWNSNHTQFGYNRDGALTEIDYPNGVDETTSYDHADNLGELTDTKGVTTLVDYTYSRNNSDEVTASTTSGASAGPTETYDVNSRDRIDSYTTGSTTGTYSYDSAGNLTSLPNGTTQAFDNADELTSTTDAASNTTDYTYDQRGDRTSTVPPSGPTLTYTYDQASQLIGFTDGTTAANYAYDGDGTRASKTVGSSTTHFTWDAASHLPLLLSDGSTSYIYGPHNLPIEQTNTDGTTIDYLHHDQQGSTRLLTDNTGTVTATYTYNPYGQTTSHTGLTTPLRYDGQYQDDETGLYYLHARYYDPTTAQFITRDPLEAQTHAPYSYADDDPLDNSDPSGLCNKNPFSGGFWTDGNCISDGVTAVYNDDVNYYKCHWRGALGGTFIDAGTVLGWASSVIPDNPVSAIAGGIATVWSAGGTYIKTGSRTDAMCSFVNNGTQNIAGVLGGAPGRVIIYGTIGNSLCEPEPAH